MTDFLEGNKQKERPFSSQFQWFALLGVMVIVGMVVFVSSNWTPNDLGIHPVKKEVDNKEKPAVVAFASEDEFKNYLAQAAVEAVGYRGMPALGMKRTLDVLEGDMDVDIAIPPPVTTDVTAESSVGVKAPSRVADTNVQVKGIDEPDIIKTDGENIYFSPVKYFREKEELKPFLRDEPLSERNRYLLPPSSPINGIKAIKAWPPKAMEFLSEFKLSGEFLLADEMLVVIGNNKIIGVSVADPQKMKKEWEFSLADMSGIVAGRLYQDVLYLVSRSNINREKPCPLEPIGVLSGEVEEKVILPCREIYHPVSPISTDSIFTVFKLDPQTGKVLAKRALVGSSGKSVVYMSPQAVYLTYLSYGRLGDYLINFFVQDDFTSTAVRDKLKRLQQYELSDQAKMVELENILNSWQAGLSRDERLRIENELKNRISDYHQKHKRELENTGIVKVKVDDLTVAAAGKVPGELLNQFSLDEYQGYLRIATTIGERGFWRWGIGRQASVSDVYVLDKNLKIVSSVEDLGKGERIYAVRFLRKRGYVVTFKQTDPFYIIDLSNPVKPLLKGELKIPGYSSYLHPLTKDLVLGIGKEGSQVKISLFLVKDVNDPREIDKYILDEYYSEVLNNHRAFLADEKNKIFFLPGSGGGYVFSYVDGKLELKKAIEGQGIKRALYLDDYFYIAGQDYVAVFSQADWQEIKRVKF